MNNVMVSVVCPAYNHEKYIRDALNSFVMQKTSFKYEILVNDDASTDSTANIIREFEKKYPNVIRGVYQKENQYHKVHSIISDLLIPLAKGKYIAICEGDDYWTDVYKLQKQFDIMEQNPTIDMCACKGVVVSADKKSFFQEVSPMNRSGVLSVEEVIRGGGEYVVTASLFYRKELEYDLYQFPRFYSIDYFRQIHGALRGGMYYINERMVAYRWMSEGSWTGRTEMNPEQRIKSLKKIVYGLGMLNKETKFKYDSTIKDVIYNNEFYLFIYDGNIKQIMNEPYKSIYKSKTLKERIKIQIKCRVPFAVELNTWIKKQRKSIR